MEHQLGVTNQNSDAISRMENLPETPVDTVEEERLDLEEDVYVLESRAAEEWTHDNPLQQQRADPVLGTVISWVEDGQQPEKGNCLERVWTCRPITDSLGDYGSGSDAGWSTRERAENKCAYHRNTLTKSSNGPTNIRLQATLGSQQQRRSLGSASTCRGRGRR